MIFVLNRRACFTSKENTMALEQHIEKLKADHASLEMVILEELHRPLPDTRLIGDLKRQKLRIKDELVRLTEHPAT